YGDGGHSSRAAGSHQTKRPSVARRNSRTAEDLAGSRGASRVRGAGIWCGETDSKGIGRNVGIVRRGIPFAPVWGRDDLWGRCLPPRGVAPLGKQFPPHTGGTLGRPPACDGSCAILGTWDRAMSGGMATEVPFHVARTKERRMLNRVPVVLLA